MKKGYEGYFADCMVLVPYRDKEFLIGFINHFLPYMKESDRFEDEKEFSSIDETLDYVAENKYEEHILYISNSEVSELRGVELFFTNDNHTICGLYCETLYPDTSIEKDFFNQIVKYCNSNVGYISYEETPPMNSKEFQNKARIMNQW